MFWNKHEAYGVQAHTVCTTQVDKTDTAERFTTVLEVEPEGYRHCLNAVVR